MDFLRSYFHRRNLSARVERYRQRRDQLVAELEEVELRAAWDGLSEDQFGRAEARRWHEQAAALRRSIDRLDVEILNLSLKGA